MSARGESVLVGDAPSWTDKIQRRREKSLRWTSLELQSSPAFLVCMVNSGLLSDGSFWQRSCSASGAPMVDKGMSMTGAARPPRCLDDSRHVPEVLAWTFRHLGDSEVIIRIADARSMVSD